MSDKKMGGAIQFESFTLMTKQMSWRVPFGISVKAEEEQGVSTGLWLMRNGIWSGREKGWVASMCLFENVEGSLCSCYL